MATIPPGSQYQEEFLAWAEAADRGTSTQHPVDELLAEHHLIRSVLDAVQARASKLSRSRQMDMDFWERAVEILGNFALLFHYAKKANHLFPAIEDAAGMRQKITALDQEQQRDIETTLELCNAVSDRDAETVQRLVAVHVGMKKQHMAREETEVLIPAKGLVGSELAAELRKTFDEMESPPGKSRASYLEVALRVVKDAGLKDPRA